MYESGQKHAKQKGKAKKETQQLTENLPLCRRLYEYLLSFRILNGKRKAKRARCKLNGVEYLFTFSYFF